jgi:hypothetical protein
MNQVKEHNKINWITVQKSKNELIYNFILNDDRPIYMQFYIEIGPVIIFDLNFSMN